MLAGAAGCTIWMLDVRTEPHLLVGKTRFGSLVNVSARYCCRIVVPFGKKTVAHGIQTPLLVTSCVSTVVFVMTSPGPVVMNELMAVEKAACRRTDHRAWTGAGFEWIICFYSAPEQQHSLYCGQQDGMLGQVLLILAWALGS
jgi:hypothetical protein